MRSRVAWARGLQAALLVAPLLAAGGPASAGPSVEETEQVYRRLHTLGVELDDVRRLLASPSSLEAADAVDAAQNELRSATQHLCRTLYRARLLAAREALASKQDASALEHLLGAEEILQECGGDPSAPSGSPEETEPSPLRVLSQR